MKNKIIILLLTSVFTNVAFSQTNTKAVEMYLDSLTSNNMFSGYLLIAENDKVIIEKGFGYSDRNKKQLNSRTTQFNLSSTSKLFTGTAVLKLIQEQKLKPTDTIGMYIKGLEYGNKVTIHQLLTHTSGLSNFYDDPKFSYIGIKKCNDMLKYIANQKFIFQPGDSVFYSTTGMILLGALIENISDLSYAEYLNQNIFKPLGMYNTSFVNYDYVQNGEYEDGAYAKGYVKDSQKNSIEKFTVFSKDFVPLSAGGIWVSAGDLLLFDRALRNGKILDKEHLAMMTTAKVHSQWEGTDFGYIWLNINNDKPTHAIGHAGNAGGHHNAFFRYDTKNTTIIILTNYGFVNIFKLSEEIEKKLF